MKTKFLQIVLTAALLVTTMYASASSLNLRTFNNSSFTVVFDGVAYNSPTSFFQLQQVSAGTHTLTVYAAQPATHLHPVHVLASTALCINPDMDVSISVNQFGTLDVAQTPCAPVITYNQYGSGNNSWNGGYYGGHGHDNDNHHNGSYYNNGYGNNTYGYGYDNNYGYGYAYGAICPVDFTALKQTVINQWFDEGKRNTMKMAITSNYFTSEQVRDLLTLLDYESSKVEMAKLFYSKTIDKQNYFKVYDAFSFQSSIGELNNYLGIH